MKNHSYLASALCISATLLTLPSVINAATWKKLPAPTSNAPSWQKICHSHRSSDAWAKVQGCLSFTKVVSGVNHSCGLTPAGGVKCWGFNGTGALGNPAVSGGSDHPVDVVGLSSGVLDISAGSEYTCAVTTAGKALCWGLNTNSQLGDNSTTRRFSPVSVYGLNSGVSSIAAGVMHTCATMNMGYAVCWGNNDKGQLGNNSTTASKVPVIVSESGYSPGSPSVLYISLGLSHTCALTSNSGAKCWGDNSDGQLGVSAAGRKLKPTDVTGLTSFVSQVEVGNTHSCAVLFNRQVKCWGSNAKGQLGNGSTISSFTPVSVASLPDVGSLSAGLDYTCATPMSGPGYCWGKNSFGQLGDGSTTDRLTPVVTMSVDSRTSSLSTGGSHTCASSYNDNRAKCWGANYSGQLGNSSIPENFSPNPIPTDVMP